MDKFVKYIRKSFIADRIFFLCVLVYVAGTFGFVHYHGLSDRFSIFMYMKLAIIQFMPVSMLFYACYIFYVMIKVRPKKLFSYTLEKLKEWLTSYVFVRGILIYIAICVFLSAMTSFKSLIPEINPFSWDPALANFDQLLHGGRAPWQILQPLLGHPVISHIIDAVYGFWFIIMLTFVIWFIFISKNELLRKQFISTYVLSWTINGTILALFFSSTGPAFFSNIYPEINNPYQGLMTYLNTANMSYPLLALEAQKHLWDWYQVAEVGTASGISSMPSMHVSIACLVVFACWRTHYVALKLFGGVFFLVILLGSVHLGWHYAIDGYLSIISTTLIWKFSAYLVSASDCQHNELRGKQRDLVLAKDG